MTVRYINVSVGATMANGDIITEHKGKGTSQANTVSLAYDDSVVTRKNQLLAAVRNILVAVHSDKDLT